MTHRNNLNIFPAACLIAISPIFDEYFLMFSKKSFKSLIDASLMDSRSFGICSRICLENLKKINQRFVIIWLACIKFWWCLSALTRWRFGFFNIGGIRPFFQPTYTVRALKSSVLTLLDRIFCNINIYVLVFQLQ